MELRQLKKALGRSLRSDFLGISCIGDVHGDIESFGALVAEAKSRKLFVIQLGDLVDRGSDSPGCLELMADLVASGEGCFLRSNHDHRLYRYFRGERLRVTPSLDVTLNQISSHPTAAHLIHRFMRIYEDAPYYLKVGQYFFVHGAFDQAMLRYNVPDFMEARPRAALIAKALYGEKSDQENSEGRSSRTYRWVDEIPKSFQVIVGHNTRSLDKVLIQTGELGGKAIFVDTGAGKGGKLSTFTVYFDESL